MEVPPSSLIGFKPCFAEGMSYMMPGVLRLSLAGCRKDRSSSLHITYNIKQLQKNIYICMSQGCIKDKNVLVSSNKSRSWPCLRFVHYTAASPRAAHHYYL